MKIQIVKIGNSRGIRLPKLVMDEVGLDREVELRVRQGRIVLTPVKRVREGWAEDAKKCRERGEDLLLDNDVPTEFDLKEWKWV